MKSYEELKKAKAKRKQEKENKNQDVELFELTLEELAQWLDSFKGN